MRKSQPGECQLLQTASLRQKSAQHLHLVIFQRNTLQRQLLNRDVLELQSPRVNLFILARINKGGHLARLLHKSIVLLADQELDQPRVHLFNNQTATLNLLSLLLLLLGSEQVLSDEVADWIRVEVAILVGIDLVELQDETVKSIARE